MSTTEREGLATRRDAQRNRRRLVAAAREVFEESGVDVPLDEIARRAALGHATLYRHFPTREALVEAIFAERADEFLAVGQEALEAKDAWEGFVGFLETIFEFQSRDRVLREIFVRYPPGEGRLTETRQQMGELFQQIIARAQAQGLLRPDFELADLAVLLWSFAPVIDATSPVVAGAWRRHLHWLLDGLRASAATPQDVPALDDEQLAASMNCLRELRFPHRTGQSDTSA